MLTILDVGADNVAGFVLDGKIEDEEYERAVRLIEEKLQRHEKLRIYTEIQKIGGLSLQSSVKNITFKLKHFRDFERTAIVCNKAWLDKYVSVMGKLFPSIEARSFTFEEKQRALKWIKSNP